MFSPDISLRPPVKSRRGGVSSLAPPSPTNVFLHSPGANPHQFGIVSHDDESRSPLSMVFDSPKASPVPSPAHNNHRNNASHDMFKSEPMSPLNLDSTIAGSSGYGIDYSDRKMKPGGGEASSRSVDWPSMEMMHSGNMHSTPSPSDTSTIMSITSPVSPASSVSSPYPCTNSPASRIGKCLLFAGYLKI